MRIISGTYKGKRLIAPKNLPVRPTTDFAKEGLFNILNHRLDFSEIGVLDLFAGTGNIGFEFCSRGAKAVTSVDQHAGCVRFIDKTASELDMPITAYKANVFKYLERPSGKYHVVFADPPYEFSIDLFEQMVNGIQENNWLHSDGMLIIEHPKQTDLSSLPGFVEYRKYGGSVFSFFEPKT